MNLDTEAREQLIRHRRVWQQKRVLGRIYHDEFFARLLFFRKMGGISVEVGGGPGFLSQMLPGLISTDIVWVPWLQAVADAQNLPFTSSRVTNIFGLDVLHHCAAPMKFLKESERVLVPGGRLILIEPWITPFSYLIYRFFHQEDCDLSVRLLDGEVPLAETPKKPFDGNQAIPYLLFAPKNLHKTMSALPALREKAIEPFCLFAYLLSFGFKPVNMLPNFLYPFVSRLERATLPFWRSIAALRVLIALEKSG